MELALVWLLIATANVGALSAILYCICIEQKLLDYMREHAHEHDYLLGDIERLKHRGDEFTF